MNDYFSSAVEVANAVSLTYILELVGTVAFAISGIRLASAKEFDWFGAIIVGFVTAVGGGTLRDLLIDVPVFWLQSSLYIWGTVLAFVIVLCFRKYLIHLNNTIFWFDCIGLALFAIVGLEKSLDAGHSYWVAVSMGTITGVVGGITRDILINEIPIVFRKEFYALACIVGGILYVALYYFNVDRIVTEISVFILIILLRVLSTRLNWHLPILKGEE